MMLHYSEYVKNLMKNYPEEAQKAFCGIEMRLDSEPEFAAAFDKLITDYMINEIIELDPALDALSELAEEKGINKYTLDFVYIMNCTELLYKKYAQKGIPEEVFTQTVDDLRCKLLECMECEGVPGTFVAGWNNGFLKLHRFAYGRFQYEVSRYNFDFDFITSSGKKLTKGDTFIAFHIPASGIPITDDIRLDSYKKAYPHYKDMFPDGNVVFGCSSWLLYPRHREFLPPHLNILKFMDDFEIVCWEEKKHFGNDWRIFGRYSDLPYDSLPKDTSLRKAYAEWLTAGNKAGDGFGVFVFDGEKIIR
ncbi:MAG: DUF5596 domain-containing protein [Oscillospiraceae bacterium]|nr:DUF5596 domain-containing protein [Oscillospiraceae bacterium]